MCLAGAVLLACGRPLMVTWHLRQGRAALASRDAPQAVQEFGAALKWDRSRGESHFWLARAYRKSGDMEGVRRHLRSAWQLGFPADRIEREEWLAMAQSGQMREAYPQLSQLLLDPRDDGQEICEAYVNGLFVACRFHEAFELLDVWQSEYPQESQPYLFRARYQALVGDTKSAVQTCRDGLRLEPDRYELQVLLAMYLVALHDFDEADKTLLELLEKHSNDTAVLATWSECLVAQGRNQEAAGVLSRLLQIEPENVKGRLAAAQLELDAGRKTAALEQAQSIVHACPYDVEARMLLATCLQACGMREEAQAEFRRADRSRQALQDMRLLWEAVLTDQPDDVEIRYQLGITIMEHNSPEAGASWLRSVLELDPHHLGAHRALAEYYERIESHDLARKHREMAERTEPEVSAAGT
jgi:Tfp pilus assembly protein PilF